MQIKKLVLLGLSLMAIPAFAVDIVRIKNKTDRTLNYVMRCIDNNSDWKYFVASPGETREISAVSCERFAFKKTTQMNDGSTQTVSYVLDANTSHILVYDYDKRRWDLRKIQQTDF